MPIITLYVKQGKEPLLVQQLNKLSSSALQFKFISSISLIALKWMAD